MLRNVYLAQVNNKFGENKVFFPYSVGLLQTHVKTQPELNEAYRFGSPLFLREDPYKVVKSLDSPDVVGISSYNWNWEWGKELAREAREQHPNSLIVMGGPQVPDRSDGFFEKHPYVNLLVHGEGEFAFSDILRERLKENSNYEGIAGLTVNKSGVSVRTFPRSRLKEDEFPPSPYLTGEFDELLRNNPDLEFHITQETHRGCPYSCTFCQWGSATQTKVRKFSENRIKAEYDWAAENKIPMIYNADANFGIFKEDEALTDYLIELKKRTGFPQQLRANWAKNSHERMYNMAKKLTDAGMGIGVTLSLQSLDSNVLDIIKRKNIKFDNRTDLLGKYEAAGIPTYTELILALPGETYATFSGGLETLFSSGQHNGINIYLLTLLENAEMNHPEYIKEHGLSSIRSPILQNHATPGEDPITEYADTVISTNAMPSEDFRKSFLFSWATQASHILGLTQDIAIYLKSQGVSYQSFYEELLLSKPDTIFGQQIVQTNKSLDRALSGGDWGEVDQRYGNIIWPLEEKSFLDVATGDLNLFYSQVEEMINRKFISIPNEVIQRQKLRLMTPEDFGGNVPEYAKKVAWFGRKFGSLKNLEGRVEETDSAIIEHFKDH
jgi:radical SAM superfamily enzyme YgiQ (UPF0313 family)